MIQIRDRPATWVHRLVIRSIYFDDMDEAARCIVYRVQRIRESNGTAILQSCLRIDPQSICYSRVKSPASLIECQMDVRKIPLNETRPSLATSANCSIRGLQLHFLVIQDLVGSASILR